MCDSMWLMNKSPHGIQALMFDVFGTLVDWRSSVTASLQTFFEQHKGSLNVPQGTNWQEMALDWRDHYQPAMEAVRSGARPFVILDVLHRESLVKVLEKHGIRGLSDAQLDELTLCWHRLNPWPEVPAAMRQLRQLKTLAAVSNGNTQLLNNLCHFADLAWHASLGAEPAKAYKPQPEAYLYSASLLTLQPGQCLFVAAHNDDLAAARALGFATAYVNRPTEYGPRQVRDTGPESDWDICVESLDELAVKLP